MEDAGPERTTNSSSQEMILQHELTPPRLGPLSGLNCVWSARPDSNWRPSHWQHPYRSGRSASRSTRRCLARPRWPQSAASGHTCPTTKPREPPKKRHRHDKQCEIDAAGEALYGDAFHAESTLNALSYYKDGDLQALDPKVRDRLLRAVTEVDLDRLPEIDPPERSSEMKLEL